MSLDPPTREQDIQQSKWSSHSPLDSEYIRDTSLKNKLVAAKNYTKTLTTLDAASIQTYPQIIKIIKNLHNFHCEHGCNWSKQCFTPFPTAILLKQMHSTVLLNFHTFSDHKTYIVYQCTSSSCFTQTWTPWLQCIAECYLQEMNSNILFCQMFKYQSIVVCHRSFWNLQLPLASKWVKWTWSPLWPGSLSWKKFLSMQYIFIIILF